MGTTYEVLYGGFRWGFTFTATDVPEPSTWAMMLLGFAGLAYTGYRKGKSARTAFADRHSGPRNRKGRPGEEARLCFADSRP
jgi:hypothetical protein